MSFMTQFSRQKNKDFPQMEILILSYSNVSVTYPTTSTEAEVTPYEGILEFGIATSNC